MFASGHIDHANNELGQENNPIYNIGHLIILHKIYCYFKLAMLMIIVPTCSFKLIEQDHTWLIADQSLRVGKLMVEGLSIPLTGL